MRTLGILMTVFRLLNRRARGNPVDREVVVGVGEFCAGFSRQRRLSNATQRKRKRLGLVSPLFVTTGGATVSCAHLT